jgi:restriction system protein
MGVPALKAANLDFFDLDALDGHGFEDACAALFWAEGYNVTMGPRTCDKGRDLILNRAGKITIVECKHYTGRVGRPVVQKLHSAIATYPEAIGGVLVTTGRFTDEAVECAHEVLKTAKIKIELIDFASLVAHGKAVGIQFASKQRGNNIHFYVPWRSDYQANAELKEFLASINSHPRVASECVESLNVRRIIRPVVRIEYQLERDFYKSERHLYTAQTQGVDLFCLDDTSLTKSEIKEISCAEVFNFEEDRILEVPPSSFFEASVDEYTNRTIHRIVHEFSRTIYYTGRNNQRYSAECKINHRDVFSTTKRLLISNWSVEFRIHKKCYELLLSDLPGQVFLIKSSKGFVAGIDEKLGKLLLCNDCAQLAPTSGSRWNRGRQCVSCNRTLCSGHAWYFPVSDFLNGLHYCAQCYPRDVKKNWKFYPWLSITSGISFGLCSLLPTVSHETAANAKVIFCAAVLIAISRGAKHLYNVFRIKRYTPPWGE